ncbi:MAG: type II toxin-antitoxin system CcdA family antitoxin [Pseudohongiellaceae bacterium]
MSHGNDPRRLNINLAASLERTLAEETRTDQRAQWLRDNAQAIRAYNEFVETNGMFSDAVRKF